MRSLLYPLRLLLGPLAFSLLAACNDSGGSSGSDAGPDIDTLNIYFDTSENDLPNDTNTIKSFHPETGESENRGYFVKKVGAPNDMFFSLNTNEEKQGFEYAAYVEGSSVKLMDYVDAEITELSSSASAFCGIHPVYEASQSSFEGEKKQRLLLNKPMAIVETNKTAEDCDEGNNFFTLISFEINNETGAIENIERTPVNSALAKGATIFDFDYVNTEGTETTSGRFGTLGIDQDGNQLELYDQNNQLLWQVPLPTAYDSEGDNWNVLQVTEKHVLLQLDEKVYVYLVKELFDIATLENIPDENKLAALFKQDRLVTFNQDDPPINSLTERPDLRAPIKNNNSTFVLEDGTTLYFHKVTGNNKSTLESLDYTRAEELQSLEYDITEGNVVLLKKIFNNHQSLSRINPTNDVETSIINWADEIEFEIINNQFYVNTKNASLEAGWQAHWFNSQLAQRTYDNSRFLFLEDTRSPDISLLLLSSDAGTPEDPMVKPSIYAFDSTQSDGRRDNFSYGQLNSNVYGVKWGSIVNGFKAGSIVNDIYGSLKFEVCHGDCASSEPDRVTEHYFFKPTQTSAEKKSLTLIERKAAE